MIFFQKYKVQNATVLHLEKINKKKMLTAHPRFFKYISYFDSQLPIFQSSLRKQFEIQEFEVT